MADILWTGDPETQKYEPWLEAAMCRDGKAMPEMINEQVCLRFLDNLIRPGEMIGEDETAAARTVVRCHSSRGRSRAITELDDD
jgi:hypothetical protein